MDKIFKRIKELRSLIKKYNDYYYVKNISLITDFEYDKLLKELEELESLKKANLFSQDSDKTISSPTKNVGSDLTKGFKKIKHKNKMLSISNSYNENDLIDFDKRVKKLLEIDENIEYCVEHKIDGVAVSISYSDGDILNVVTRGDGTSGDDVTNNAVNIKNLPRKSSNLSDFEVRGEVYISKSDFKELNRNRELDGLDLMANPRNTASGSLKLMDSMESSKRPLSLILYYYSGSDSKKYHSENLNVLKNNGFPAPAYSKVCNSINEVIRECRYWETHRNSLEYEIDGMVIKVNDTELYNKLGMTGRYPRWMIAYKFKPETAETELIDITLQVGRTGAVTPVAELEPVFISGTTVRRATLHNQDEIKEKDIRVGDTVILEKAGEIIPKITSVVISKRKDNSKVFKMPEDCPVCGEKLVRTGDEIKFRCVNSSCPAQIEKRIEHFASKNAMNITGMGIRNVKLLLENKLINDISDIYMILSDDIEKLDRMGEKSASNLLESIRESKNRSLENLIFGLGIRHVGKEVSIILAEKYRNLNAIMSADKEELESIDEIGSKIAESITLFMSNEKNKELISKLISYGLNTDYLSSEIIDNKAISGKTFVVTGTLEKYTRDEIKSMIKQLGGKTVSKPSKNTDYVIFGDNPGSKYDLSIELGLKLLSENEFEDMIS